MAGLATTARLLHATREAWTKGMSDETVDNHPLLKLLQSKGRIKYGCTGTKNKWTVKYKKLPLEGYADMDVLTFARKTLTKPAEVEWRGYKMVDAISEPEMMMNEGGSDTQIVDLVKGKLESMKEDADDQIGQELYIDGDAAGNSKRFHGILSMMSYTQGSVAAGDRLVNDQDDTYATLSTAYGNYGGSSGDPEYEFFTPIIVNATVDAEAWSSHATKAIRRANIYTKRSMKKSHRLDIGFTSRENFAVLCDQLEDKERIVVPTRGIAKFGFEDVVNVDGVDITFDPDIPSLDEEGRTIRAILFNTDQMELRLLGRKKQLWNASGDEFRSDNMSSRFWIGLYGNLVFKSPRHFAMIVDAA